MILVSACFAYVDHRLEIRSFHLKENTTVRPHPPQVERIWCSLLILTLCITPVMSVYTARLYAPFGKLWQKQQKQRLERERGRDGGMKRSLAKREGGIVRGVGVWRDWSWFISGAPRVISIYWNAPPVTQFPRSRRACREGAHVTTAGLMPCSLSTLFTLLTD